MSLHHLKMSEYAPVVIQQFNNRSQSVNPLVSLAPVTSSTPSSPCNCLSEGSLNLPVSDQLWYFAISKVSVHLVSYRSSVALGLPSDLAGLNYFERSLKRVPAIPHS